MEGVGHRESLAGKVVFAKGYQLHEDMNIRRPAMPLPNIIVLATGKGGAGKSTLARSLAAH